jgi:hypothetical protein
MADILGFKQPAKVKHECKCGCRREVRHREAFASYGCSVEWSKEHMPSAVKTVIPRGNRVN